MQIEELINTRTNEVYIVEYDQYPESPREWCNDWIINTFESGYISPDRHDYYDIWECLADLTKGDQEDLQDMELDDIQRLALENNYYLEFITRYEHGNVRYYRGRISGWDYSVCGVAYTPMNCHGQTRKKLIKRLDEELKIYTDWTNGDVYYLAIENFCGDLLDGRGSVYNSNNDSWIELFNDVLCVDCDEADFIDYDERYIQVELAKASKKEDDVKLTKLTELLGSEELAQEAFDMIKSPLN